jgi:homoserine O-acetyltransferase
MRYHSWLLGLAAGLWLGGTAAAAEYPAPREADWVAHDFHFHTGETVPELRLHYLTVGNPAGEPVVILHGTAGSGASMLTPDFAGELFGRGRARCREIGQAVGRAARQIPRL